MDSCQPARPRDLGRRSSSFRGVVLGFGDFFDSRTVTVQEKLINGGGGGAGEDACTLCGCRTEQWLNSQIVTMPKRTVNPRCSFAGNVCDVYNVNVRLRRATASCWRCARPRRRTLTTSQLHAKCRRAVKPTVHYSNKVDYFGSQTL